MVEYIKNVNSYNFEQNVVLREFVISPSRVIVPISVNIERIFTIANNAASMHACIMIYVQYFNE